MTNHDQLSKLLAGLRAELSEATGIDVHLWAPGDDPDNAEICTHEDHWDAVYSAMPCPGCTR